MARLNFTQADLEHYLKAVKKINEHIEHLHKSAGTINIIEPPTSFNFLTNCIFITF